MITVKTTINKLNVTLVAVERGESLRQVKKELGISNFDDNFTVSSFGSDPDFDSYEDFADYTDDVPEAAAFAGKIAPANIVAVIEVR